MIIFRTIPQLQQHLQKLRNNEKQVGFTPTMGALHEGHLSLIQLSKEQCDVTVCSIFVNPTQFNDPKDFEKYPVTTDKDIQLLEQAGCDILFLPSVEEMYPSGLATDQHYELGYLENILEGAFRPGHFQGVCRIVDRLLSIVEPNRLFMGSKDYQQCMVVNKLLKLTGKQDITLVIAPTQRENSGLAMSSRNMRLSNSERDAATAIFSVLQYIKANQSGKSVSDLKQYATDTLHKAGFEKIDYVEICHAITLQPLQEINNTPAVALIAAFMNNVRLIDNMVLN